MTLRRTLVDAALVVFLAVCAIAGTGMLLWIAWGGRP